MRAMNGAYEKINKLPRYARDVLIRLVFGERHSGAVSALLVLEKEELLTTELLPIPDTAWPPAYRIEASVPMDVALAVRMWCEDKRTGHQSVRGMA